MTIGVPIVTCLPRLYQQCTNRKKQSKTVKTVKRQSKQQKMTIGIPIVTCLPRLYQLCANSVPIVKNSQKTVKRQNDQFVYQSSHDYTESAEYMKSASAVRVRVRRIHKATIRKVECVNANSQSVFCAAAN